MASGLEIRVPFMDHRLVEYLFNVPWEYKRRNTSGEGLLYDVGARLLPEPVVRRDKGSYQKTFIPCLRRYPEGLGLACASRSATTNSCPII